MAAPFTLTTIQATDCIGYSRETINTNFTLLSGYVSSQTYSVPPATSLRVGGVQVSNDNSGLGLTTQGYLSANVDNQTIKIVNNKLQVQFPVTAPGTPTATTYTSGSGIIITPPVNGSYKISTSYDNRTIKLSANNTLYVVPSAIKIEELQKASTTAYGVVKLGGGLYANNGTISVKTDKTLSLNTLQELTVNLPEVPIPSKGIQAFTVPGTYSYVVPVGVYWLKVYAVAGGAGDKGKALGGSTFFGEYVNLGGGTENSGGLGEFKLGATGIVIPGILDNTVTTKQLGHGIYNNLKIKNTAFSVSGELPGTGGDRLSGSGAAAIAMIRVSSEQKINIVVGAGGGIETPGTQGIIVVEY